MSTDLLISNEEKAKILADLKTEQAPVEERLKVMEAAAYVALREGCYAQFAVEMRNWDETAHKLAIPRTNPVAAWLAACFKEADELCHSNIKLKNYHKLLTGKDL